MAPFGAFCLAVALAQVLDLIGAQALAQAGAQAGAHSGSGPRSRSRTTEK